MIIYNVTVNIEKKYEQDWLQWMREQHIPDVMSTGLFQKSRLFKVMVEEEQGITYSIQYEVRDRETLQLYQEVYAPKLQAEFRARYGDRAVSFRTLLQLESEHE